MDKGTPGWLRGRSAEEEKQQGSEGEREREGGEDGLPIRFADTDGNAPQRTKLQQIAAKAKAKAEEAKVMKEN